MPVPTDLPALPAAHTALLSTLIPPQTLTTLLENRTPSRGPLSPSITHLSRTHVGISYTQPVRQYWYHPIPQLASIPLRSLPQTPVPSSPSDAWARQVLAAIEKERPEEVTRYVAPRGAIEWAGVGVFVVFTLAIVAWIVGVGKEGWLGRWVFTSEGRFNTAVMVHVVVLVKRSQDVTKMGQLLGRHWKGSRVQRWAWTMSCWVEGWRAVGRFMGEVERVAMESEEGKKKQ